jgi:hypothetical protein
MMFSPLCVFYSDILSVNHLFTIRCVFSPLQLKNKHNERAMTVLFFLGLLAQLQTVYFYLEMWISSAGLTNEKATTIMGECIFSGFYLKKKR